MKDTGKPKAANIGAGKSVVSKNGKPVPQKPKSKHESKPAPKVPAMKPKPAPKVPAKAVKPAGNSVKPAVRAVKPAVSTPKPSKGKAASVKLVSKSLPTSTKAKALQHAGTEDAATTSTIKRHRSENGTFSNKYPLNKLKIGQSWTLELDKESEEFRPEYMRLRSAISIFCKRNNVKISCKQIEEGVLVTRIL